ncbi:hypothetical protein [Streptomyces sp. NPDC007088]|uniref:hypothetical protein n=1 Tax=Streptomyces sp. NPDC007088 TaxID=3364773 RepID=UPI00368D3E07
MRRQERRPCLDVAGIEADYGLPSLVWLTEAMVAEAATEAEAAWAAGRCAEVPLGRIFDAVEVSSAVAADLTGPAIRTERGVTVLVPVGCERVLPGRLLAGDLLVPALGREGVPCWYRPPRFRGHLDSPYQICTLEAS